MSNELNIPNASFQAMLDCRDVWMDETELHGAIGEIAAPVVAAELRRIAERLGTSTAAMHLRDRADELDNGQ